MTVTDFLPTQTPEYRPETPADHAAVDRLIDRVFGPGRLTKVSERVREFAAFAADQSFCAWDGTRLLGAVRMWRVNVGGQPAMFLGPLAVDPDLRKIGVGRQLVTQACDAARAAGERAVLLVGDEPYFSRVGFAAAPAAEVRMPGPVDQRRVLANVFVGGVALAGSVGPR